MKDETYKYLNRPKKINAKLIALNEQIGMLRYSLMPSGIRYDQDKVQTSPDDMLSKVVSELTALERERDTLCVEANDICNEMRKTFAGLSAPEYSNALVYSFISCLKYEDAMERMHCSKAQFFRYRKKGMEELDVIVSKKLRLNETK